ncbi:MAG TPA: translocation/assembly module TamB domain-containing protein, partial [Vicinamibacterales bacterium]|nr:translocation/assembly module TamB domain-containing protein [Vicinamibacterales bacterium]
GEVSFGGRIGLVGFTPGALNLTARGERMNVRYPEGFRSNVNVDLALQGTLATPTLTGKVSVNDAVWSRRIEATPDLFALTGGGAAEPPAGAPPAAAIPLRFDIAIEAQESLRIENNLAKMVASADLRLQGTYDRPLLFGRAEIDRGDFVFEGNRYLVTQGSVDFYNPSRIEPFFDIEAETRVRLPGQTYRITVGLTGTTARMAPPTLNSDPPLPMVDIIALLFGQTTGLENAELRALRPELAQQSEEALLRQGMARLLASPVSTPVGRVFEDAFNATVQITPTFGTNADLLTPSARIVIGKRVSNRVYLTYAHALGNTQRDQILILEYDQSDRVGWVLTQNGDGTFAIDFRVRHRF